MKKHFEPRTVKVNRHVCYMGPTNKLRFLKQGNKRILQVEHLCHGCGKRQWVDVPTEVEEKEAGNETT